MAKASPLLWLYQLKFIALALEEADGSGEGILQIAVVPGLQGIVEGDDGAATGVFHHIGEYLGPAELLAVVARDDIPHHDAVVVAQHDVLLPAHPAMGRTEQAGVQHLVGFIGIFQVGVAGVTCPTDMVVGVVAYAVTVVHHHLVDLGVLAYIVAYHEERGLDTFTAQQTEYPRGDEGDGPIVEGEINGLLLWVDAPQGLRIEAAEDTWYLLDDHGRLFYTVGVYLIEFSQLVVVVGCQVGVVGFQGFHNAVEQGKVVLAVAL